MRPEIISRDRLVIMGLTGEGSKTGEVWEEFEKRYGKEPFPKADACWYEIRFYDTPRAKDVHVGAATEGAGDIGEFTAVALPASQYAVFDVYVAQGYDSGNAQMEQWLADHAGQYRQGWLDGAGYVVECYNEKFKGGGQPDSIVEIWVPVAKEGGP